MVHNRKEAISFSKKLHKNWKKTIILLSLLFFFFKLNERFWYTRVKNINELYLFSFQLQNAFQNIEKLILKNISRLQDVFLNFEKEKTCTNEIYRFLRLLHRTLNYGKHVFKNISHSSLWFYKVLWFYSNANDFMEMHKSVELSASASYRLFNIYLTLRHTLIPKVKHIRTHSLLIYTDNAICKSIFSKINMATVIYPCIC